MPQALNQFLITLISKHQLSDAFEILDKSKSQLPEEEQQAFVLMSSRHQRLTQNKHKGIVAKADLELEENKITEALIAFVKAIPEDIKVEESLQKALRRKNRQWLWQLGIAGLVLVPIAFWLLQKIDHIPLTAELSVDRVSLTLEQQSALFKNLALEKIEVQNFEDAWIEGNTYHVSEENTGLLSAGQATFTPLEGIDGGSMRFSSSKLQQLDIAPGTQITLDKPNDLGGKEIILDSRGTHPLKGRLSYTDSLQISIDYASTSLPGITEILDPQRIQIGCNSLACEASFSCFSDGGSLNLHFKENLNQPELGLEISGLRFSRPLSGREISSILSGKLIIQQPGKKVFQEIELQTNDELVLSNEKAKLLNLDIASNQMFLSFSGTFEQAAYGQGFDLNQISPRRLVWVWHNYRLFLITGAFVFILLTFFLPPAVRAKVWEVLKLVKKLFG